MKEKVRIVELEMMRMRALLLLLLLICTVWAVSLSDGFNIDVAQPEHYEGSAEDFFGYKVLQFDSGTHKRIIVSAPLSGNNKKHSGAIYSCEPQENCMLLHQQELDNVHFFGMSMAASRTSAPLLTSCSPSLTHSCDGNSYLNSMCYQFNNNLKTMGKTKGTVAFQVCPKGAVNLVFLFDGSGSLNTEEFNLNKKLMWDVMETLKNTTIQFAAVQFSTTHRTVFTFEDYKKGTTKKKLDDEERLADLTNTHKAMKFVRESIFDNVSIGAQLEATKALVIITDGTPTDNIPEVITQCDEQNIIRFVIGVGKVDLTSLQKLASHPKRNNTFMIEDYKGLEGLLDNLQTKIYNTEGDQGGLRRARKKELSQSGFSAVYAENKLILGAVGSNDWRGSLYEVETFGVGAKETEIKDPNLNEDSYMGYSVAFGKLGRVSLLCSGAPRSEHRGQVTVFSKSTDSWTNTFNITGEQVGSYFGASLCLLDVDSDNNTDFLVVGAPLYYQAMPQREGRMYVYSITPQLELVKVLEMSESVQGRFATSVASLADLNGDGLQDVAVGAPLEDEGRGAVYIYLGNHSQGVRPWYSQRIAARLISDQLQQFGVDIDGTTDIGGDGLTDIAVGTRGSVVLLKTLPVLSLTAQIKFSPSKIILNNEDCQTAVPVLNLTTCFDVKERTKNTGTVSRVLNVSVELKADAVRQDSRAFFQQSDKNSRRLLTSLLLNSQGSCFNQTVYMLDCVRDTLTPVKIWLNFSQAEQQPSSSNAVLDIDSKTSHFVEIPFQRNCRNASCVADLALNFTFMNSTLLVVDQAYFIVLVTLVNNGDDSFSTSITLHYPTGLSLSTFETVKASRRTLSRCGDRDDGILNRTTCSINLPVYCKDTSATFRAAFRILKLYDWGETMNMTLVADSDNNNGPKRIVTKSLAVQFAADVAVSPVPERSVTYLNLSLEDRGPKPVVIIYKVTNDGLKGLPVSVKFTVPSHTGQNYSLKHHLISVAQNLTDCRRKEESENKLCPKWMMCVKFECADLFLKPQSVVEFELRASLTFPNLQQYTGRWFLYKFRTLDSFSICAQLDFDNHQMSSEQDADTFHKSKLMTRRPKQESSSHVAPGIPTVLISVYAELIIPADEIAVVSCEVGGCVLFIIFIIMLLWDVGLLVSRRQNDSWNVTEDINAFRTFRKRRRMIWATLPSGTSGTSAVLLAVQDLNQQVSDDTSNLSPSYTQYDLQSGNTDRQDTSQNVKDTNDI